jgi:SpoIID/LytB domain protein
MKRVMRLWCFLVVMCAVNAASPSVDFFQVNKPATIKVLLQTQGDGVIVEVKGRHYIYNPTDDEQLSFGLRDRRFVISCDKDGICWGERFPGIYQLRFVPGDSQSSILVNGIQYKGCLEVYYNKGTYDVVNEVEIERYLKTILSAQIGQTPLHEEVLNAMVIAERTTAYFLSEHKRKDFWHVSAQDVHYQGNAFLLQPCVCRAVDMTQQAILKYEGDVFPALCTENSAGKTVDFTTAFRKVVPTPAGVISTVAAKDRLSHQWHYSISKEEFAHKVGLDPIVEMKLYVKLDKVYGLKIIGKSQEKDIDFMKFQRIIGKKNILSNDFTVDVCSNDIIFHGFGNGHGVGLCLYSAKILAERGEKAPQILATFFPGSRLEKMQRR